MIIGRLGRPYGILGFVYLQSFTEPKDNILKLTPWYIKKDEISQKIIVEDYKIQNRSIIVKPTHCNDRNQASYYTNYFLEIEREQLPSLEKDEFYWVDLEGLNVINKKNIQLGKVEYLLRTKANDILVVDKYLIPYIEHVILKIDLKRKKILVDWQE